MKKTIEEYNKQVELEEKIILQKGNVDKEIAEIENKIREKQLNGERPGTLPKEKDVLISEKEAIENIIEKREYFDKEKIGKLFVSEKNELAKFFREKGKENQEKCIEFENKIIGEIEKFYGDLIEDCSEYVDELDDYLAMNFALEDIKLKTNAINGGLFLPKCNLQDSIEFNKALTNYNHLRTKII